MARRFRKQFMIYWSKKTPSSIDMGKERLGGNTPQQAKDRFHDRWPARNIEDVVEVTYKNNEWVFVVTPEHEPEMDAFLKGAGITPFAPMGSPRRG